MREAKEQRFALGGLGLVVVVGLGIFAPLLGDAVPYFRDALRTDLPVRSYIASTLSVGHVPQWYSWDGLGLQFIGNAEGLFRLQNLLYFFVSPVTGFKLELIVDFLLGGLGFLLFAQRLGARPTSATVGALAFAFSGYAISQHTNLPYVAPYHTVPWLLWAARGALSGERPWKEVALTAFFWAQIVLGGDPLLSILMGGALVTLVASLGLWREGLRLLVAVPLTAALCMVWALPANALFVESLRNGWTPDGTTLAMHLARLPELLLGGGAPDIEPMIVLRGGLDGGRWWSASLLLGGTVVGLALLSGAKRAGRAWLVLALVALWLALGAAGGLHTVAITVLPLLGKFRYPEKYFALAGLAFAVAATLGAEDAFGAPRRRLGLLFGVVAVLAVLGLGSVAFSASDWTGSARADLRMQWIIGAAIALTSLGAALASLVSAHPVLKWGPALCVAAELLVSGRGLVWVVPGQVLRTMPSFCKAAIDNGAGVGQSRITNRVREFPQFTGPEDGLSWATATLNLLEPCTVSLCDLEGVTRPGLSGTPARLDVALKVLPGIKFSQLFNAGVGVVNPAAVQEQAVIKQEGAYVLVRTPEPVLPRAFAAKPSWVQSAEAARDALRDRPVEQFTSEVVLEGTPQPMGPDEGEPGRVKITNYLQERVELAVSLPSARAVVLNDQWSAGWSATIDGVAAPVLHANYLVRAVLVPAGQHTVVFTFETPGLATGATISFVALLLVVVMVLKR